MWHWGLPELQTKLSRIANGTVHSLQKTTEVWLIMIREFCTELLTSLTEYFTGLAFLQDGMYIILEGVAPRLW